MSVDDSARCSNIDCHWFGTDHAAEHPCGERGERPGEPCRSCGRELLVGEDACPNCWTPITDGILPGFEPPPPVSALEEKHKPPRIQRRLTDAARIEAGVHPATRMPLANNGKTCGDCALLREKNSGGFHGWKCGTPDPRSKNHRGDGRDMTKRWPACIAFQPKDGDTT